VQFLGTDVRDDRDAARDFVTDRRVTYPSIFDPAMRSLIALGRHYPTSVVPTTIFLDRRHRVAAVFLMALLAEDLRPLIDRLTTEPQNHSGHRFDPLPHEAPLLGRHRRNLPRGDSGQSAGGKSKCEGIVSPGCGLP
jgi:hypothetical protein